MGLSGNKNKDKRKLLSTRRLSRKFTRRKLRQKEKAVHGESRKGSEEGKELGRLGIKEDFHNSSSTVSLETNILKSDDINIEVGRESQVGIQFCNDYEKYDSCNTLSSGIENNIFKNLDDSKQRECEDLIEEYVIEVIQTENEKAESPKLTDNLETYVTNNTGQSVEEFSSFDGEKNIQIQTEEIYSDIDLNKQIYEKEFNKDNCNYNVQNNNRREIVQLNYILKEFLFFYKEHADTFDCKSELKLKERRNVGLKTQLHFSCDICAYKALIWSEDPSEKLGINQAAVLGTINIGIGYTQLLELLAAMNISAMTDMSYRADQRLNLELLEKVTLDSMIQAGKEEKKLAIANNQIHNGIPWIVAVSDGSWMTRSNGTNYNSLSGLAVIIGFFTGKVLFIGMRNKYCSTCAFAERNNITVRSHICYKNWDRNAPSTAMESDIIVEGFKCSIEMHGLIYKILVTDGDSSVYKNIVDNNVYSQYDLIPIRIRCYNHLLRNLCNKLRITSKTTQSRGSNKINNFVTLRNIIRDNIMSFRRLIEESIDSRRSSNKNCSLKQAELRSDILSIPNHIFGDHIDCNNRGYTCEEKCKALTERERNYVPDLKKTVLYEQVIEAINNLSKHCESLLYKVSNNIAESFNNIVCVEIGGKRINFGLASQYNTRVFSAVIRHNSQQVLSECYEHVTEDVPIIVKTVDTKRQLKIARTREARRVRGRKKYFYGSKNSDKYYGDKSLKVDINDEDMKMLQENHFRKLRENQNKRNEIESNTRDQYNCIEWVYLRKQLLTASHFATVIKSKDSTSCASKVRNILYPSVDATRAMQYGIDHESDAIKQLENKLKVKISRCGLFIDSEHPFLGCTPDGVIGTDGIVEIKCPFSAADLTAEQAIKTVPGLKLLFKEKNDVYELNQSHNYYYQVQGQLRITGRKFCIFAMWTPKSMIDVRVEKDNVFWKEKMEYRLKRFYMECLLPELIDSRKNRSMPIREPDYILKAKENEKNKEKKITKRNYDDAFKNANKVNENIKKQSDEEKSDVILVKDIEYQKWTEMDTLRTVNFIEGREITVNDVALNVLSPDSQLNDDSLDAFIRIVQKNQSTYIMQSVLYGCYNPNLIKSVVQGKGIAIIGGSCIHHWRVAYYDENIIKLYDSLISHTNGELHKDENRYLKDRFPNAKKVVLQEMAMQQKDSTSCGVYSVAIAVDIILGFNPSLVKYSVNTVHMRQHFVDIIRNQRLSRFPTE